MTDERNPVEGFAVREPEDTAVSIPEWVCVRAFGWVYNEYSDRESMLDHGGTINWPNTYWLAESKCMANSHTYEKYNREEVMVHLMRSNQARTPHTGVEFEVVEIIDITETERRPIQPNYRGTLRFRDGSVSKFVTNIDGLESTCEYQVAYEYTTTLMSETAVEIKGVPGLE